MMKGLCCFFKIFARLSTHFSKSTPLVKTCTDALLFLSHSPSHSHCFVQTDMINTLP